MTNEELERMMDFIIERQNFAAAQIASIAETQSQQDERIKRSERSYSIISDLLQRHDGQLMENANKTDAIAETQSQHDERIKRFERSYTAISDLLQRHDDQLVILTDNANHTNEVVAGLAMSIAETNEVVASLATSIINTKEVVAGLAVTIANTNATVDRLGVTVERYIAALGNGSMGGNGQG